MIFSKGTCLALLIWNSRLKTKADCVFSNMLVVKDLEKWISILKITKNMLAKYDYAFRVFCYVSNHSSLQEEW